MIHNARANDPVTSFLAGDEIEVKGYAEAQRQICLNAVKKAGGMTSAEIAHITGTERHMPARRLPELRAKGLVMNGENKICSVCGRLSMTWEVC